VSLWIVRHYTHETLQYLCKTHKRARERRQHREWMQCIVVQIIQKRKICNKTVMLYSMRNVTEVLLDRQYVRYVLRSYSYNCNSLFTCFLSHQVFNFTHMPPVHFSAFFVHYPRCNTLAVRTLNCRLLQRHFRDVAPRPPRITDITLSRMTVAPVAICPGIGTRSR